MNALFWLQRESPEEKGKFCKYVTGFGVPPLALVLAIVKIDRT